MHCMPQPRFTPLNYSYQKPDNGIWVLNTDDIPLERSLLKDQQLVHLAPGSMGGNHRHPRTEWFIALGELELAWLDEQGQLHQQTMPPEEGLLLIEMPPLVPHAVINHSTTHPAILFEYADAKQTDVEVSKVL